MSAIRKPRCRPLRLGWARTDLAISARLHARADDARIEPALPRRDRDLAQLFLRCGREAAECFHLELIGDGADQETAPERPGCRVAIEGTPALPKRVEAEAGKFRDLSLDLLLCLMGHRFSPRPSRWPLAPSRTGRPSRPRHSCSSRTRSP